MAFTGITATEAEINQKSGANVSASYTDTMKTQCLLQAENFVNVATRYNFSDNWGSLNVDVKYLVTEVTASIVAIEAIKYDMSGYTTRVEAEDMINVLWARIQECMKLLVDQKGITYMKGA